MKLFFLILEMVIPLFAGYVILRKGSLAIVYMPFLYFCTTIIGEKELLPGPFNDLLFVVLLLYFVLYNLPFVKRNIFSILLIFYYFILLVNVDDFFVIRKEFIGVMWLFTSVALVPEIFKYYKRDAVFGEVSNCAFLIMVLFVVNAILSTYFKYNPYEVYGITTGVLFGKMSTDIYNILPISMFIIIRKGIKDKNIFFILLYLASFFLVMLTLRRTVMALTVLATVIVMIELLNFKQIKEFVLYAFLIAISSVVVVYYTGFAEQFVERYEKRGLENRSLAEENRFMEFDIVFKDMFVYYDYSPFFGFGLFDSNGNYGKKIFGDRSLHTDYANIIHSSGFIGLILYLLMMYVAFYTVWKKTYSKGDLLQFSFVLLFFLVFFINGRYTTTTSMLMMLHVLFLPMAREKLTSEKKSNVHGSLAVPIA